METIIGDDLPTIEEALADLKDAWQAGQSAEAYLKTKRKEFGLDV